MFDCDTTKLINRLKRIEGQVRGIQRMLSNEQTDCKAIITQMSAVRSGINNLMGIVMAENLKKVIENSEKDIQKQREKLSEAIDMIVKK